MTEAQDERYGRLTNKRENESVHFWHLSIPVPMSISFFVARLSSEQKKVKGRAFPGMSCIRKKTKVKMFLLEKKTEKDGSGCGTVAENTSRDREVLGSNPPFAGLFSSLLYPISSLSLIRTHMEVQHY